MSGASDAPVGGLRPSPTLVSGLDRFARIGEGLGSRETHSSSVIPAIVPPPSALAVSSATNASHPLPVGLI
jgi:hypothetical protein